MRKLLLVLAGLALVGSQTVSSYSPMDERTYDIQPSNDLSAIRYIECDGSTPDMEYVGSGSLIGPRILLTALHVATAKNCRDSETGGKLVLYKRDDKHDLALMTGPTLPTDIPYYKMTCSRFVTGRKYLSYGITPYGQKRPILRDNVITATKDYTSILDLVGDTPAPGMREFDGAIAPGMSGGPVVDPDNGLIYAVNNAGSENDTVLYELADGMMCNKS